MDKPTILFEDNHLLCVVKPAGLATQPSLHNIESLETYAKDYIKNTYNKPGNVFLHAVHRLDKPTSGIVLFAKSAKALSRLNEMMRKGVFVKTYYATVEGILTSSQGMLEHYLEHGEHKAIVRDAKHPAAKKCRLRYKALRVHDNSTELEIELETGRYHQIRAQLAAAGHPIVGDRAYGAASSFSDGSIKLHHGKLLFCHPVTKEELVITALPPQCEDN